MFVICFIVCFIIHGDSTLGEDVEIDSPITDSTDAISGEVLPMEHIKEKPTTVEGRGKQRLIKGKLKLVVKALILFKLLLFIVSLPLSAITAKILSWNAVALSLLAFVTSKLVLVRSLFQGQPGPSATLPTSPIIIQSSSDPARRYRGGSKIYIQPDLHIPDVEEDNHRRKRW